MAAERDVFISAVSSEFGRARDAVANDLQARGLQVHVQRAFRQGDGTLLEKLHDHIGDYEAVVALIGARSGAFPTDGEAAPYADLLRPYGLAHASYTQWEVIFARHHGRRLLRLFAGPDWTPDSAPGPGDDADAQADFAAALAGLGLDRSEGLGSVDAIRAEVLKQDWPSFPRTRPISTPFASIGSLFKGREGVMEDLARTLGAAPRLGAGVRAAALVDAAVVHGLGGVGKTRAAIEYALRHREAHSALLFATAESPEALERNLAGLTGMLLPEQPRLAEAETEARIAAVLDWLATHPGWLLVLDNVDAPEAVAAVEAMLGRLSGGAVLVTSRMTVWPDTVKSLELDVLALKDAAAYLLEASAGRVVTHEDEALAAQLTERLGHLSIALVQAAQYMKRRRIGFARYAELWEASRAKVNAAFDKRQAQYPLPVAATWKTSVDLLGQEARALLGLLAQLSIEPIPRALLDVPAPGLEEADLEDAAVELCDLSLAAFTPDGAALSVHRLVQEVTRDDLTEADDQDPALAAALAWLRAATADTNPQDVRDWPRLTPLMPHALAAADRPGAEGEAQDDARSHLLNEFGMLLHVSARHAEAEPLFRRALAIDEARHGPDHPTVAIRLNNLAGLLRATNRLGEAEPLFRRALAIDETSYGPDHPKVAIRLNNLAALLQATDRLGEAEPLFRRALAIDETSYGPDHPKVATDLNNLAALLQATDRLGEAEPLFRRALEIDEASYGPDHPEVATDLNNLAGLLQATDRLGEAEPLSRRMLLIFLRFTAATGHPHPHLRAATMNYAVLLSVLGLDGPTIRARIDALYAEAGLEPPDWGAL
jgi:tetratricopeptide (TPR) repeat protein